MQHFNYLCATCANQLIETGYLLVTPDGPFICCDICRTLYFVDTTESDEGRPMLVVEPTLLAPEVEFDIIRRAEKRIPLREYLNSAEKKIVNPHFEEDFKSMIAESVTPGDLIRKLHKTNI